MGFNRRIVTGTLHRLMGLRCFFATNNAPTGTGSHISWNGKRRKMGLRSCPAEQPAKGSDYAADVGTESCCIEDDGVGFDPDLPRQGHYGIVGLHEQAALMGAQLSIDSAPGRGTVLTITLRMTHEML